MKLINQALIANWHILLENTRSTLLTLVAAYLLLLLPQYVYSKFEALVLNKIGANQKRRILQEHLLNN